MSTTQYNLLGCQMQNVKLTDASVLMAHTNEEVEFDHKFEEMHLFREARIFATIRVSFSLSTDQGQHNELLHQGYKLLIIN